jgi:superfamily I DNA/RNA helicase
MQHPADLRDRQVGERPVAVALETDPPDQPSVVVLPVPEPYGQRRVAGYAIEKSLPDGVGAFVHWLLAESKWTVTERTMRDELPIPVAIEPRHICILFRRFLHFGEDVTRPYVDALEARGVPHLLVGGKSFHDREEVETIRAALAAIEWPDDELSVFATLKGSLFAIDDEPLLEFRHRFGTFHPFRVPKELGGNSGQELALTAEPTAQLTAIAEALRLLQQLHRARNYRPVADTIGRLLAATRAHVGFILRPAGEQALANVLHVAELARQYEAGGGISSNRETCPLARSLCDSVAAARDSSIQANSSARSRWRKSKAPHLMRFSRILRLAMRESSRRQKSSNDVNSPLSSRSWIANSIAPWPTFLIAASP